MKDQLLKILEVEGLTPAKFADEIGVQRSSISHIISGRNKPSYDFIMKIIDRFPGINTEWLLTGKGTLFKSSNNDPVRVNTETSLFNQQSEENKPGQEQVKIQNKDLQKELKEIPVTHKNLKSDSVDQNNAIKGKFTNVNNIDFVLIFYKDGFFEKFQARDQ